MGGVVSTGRDNDDLVDNLKEADYIKSENVEQVFRIVDRAHYYLPECRESAYKDLAWKSGTLHLSAPCIYSEVMEALELDKGLSFLNLGSGTGYLNTLVGFMIGSYGINHGIELHANNVSYAEQRLKEFKQTSPKFDDLELCDPVFVQGNCLNLAPDNRRYDRVYCGAACPPELISTVQNMIKIHGILVVPVGDQAIIRYTMDSIAVNTMRSVFGDMVQQGHMFEEQCAAYFQYFKIGLKLLKIKRISETDFSSENVLPVSFASLVEPSAPKDVQEMIILPEVNPMTLQDICRITIRESIRCTFTFVKHPPKSSADSPKQNKILHTSRVFRQERGRYPLNILPTTQGLMIMGAFTDDSEVSDGSEQFDGGYLDQQLQQHALGRRQNVDTAEVDSNLSDEEEENSVRGKKGDGEKAGIIDKYLRSARQKLESMESEDGIVADDEGDGDEFEMKEMPLVKGNEEEKEKEEKVIRSLRKDGPSKSFKAGASKKGPAKRMKLPIFEKRTWVETREIVSPSKKRESFSSDDDVIVPESNGKSSSAIEMNLFDSNDRTIKTSYSNSAETSETSGFGSLGDDQIHVVSVNSGLGNVEGELDEDKNEKSGDEVLVFPGMNFPHQSNSSDDVETANEDDDDESEDDDDDVGMEEAYMDIDDDDHMDSSRTSRQKKVLSEDAISDNPDKNGEEEKSEVQPPPLPLTGFTVFLKKQVDTLPIPSTMKNYICHFR